MRYVGFVVEAGAPVDRQALIDAVRRTGRTMIGAGVEAVQPWLTRFDGTHGILRCTHTGVADVRRILEAISAVGTGAAERAVRIRTVGTSGTIRALTAKHVPELADAGRGRGGD